MGKAETLFGHIAHWAKERPSAPALHAKRGGAWAQITWAEYWRNVQDLAKGLIGLGLAPGDAVAMVGPNAAEWVQVQFATQAARAVPAPIYATCTLAQSGHIVRDSGAKILLVGSAEAYEKFLEAERQDEFPALAHIVAYGEDTSYATDPRAIGFEELLRRGRDENPTELNERLAAAHEDEVCQLIYTSGTTGQPKGVQMTHRSQLHIGEGVVSLFPEFEAEGSYHQLSYLPLSHQAENLLTNVFGLLVGGEVYFCPDLALIKDYLAEVRPTIFLGVPRVWEKFEAALRANLAQRTGVMAKVVSFCRDAEFAAFEEQVERGDPGFMPLKRVVARKLLVDKIKGALGLDRLRVAVTGSAPMNPETQRFFASIGIGILEAYGMTENSGLATLSDRRRPRFATVGRALPGIDIKLGAEGEILIKGPNNTPGYLGLDDATAELYDDDGYLHTGDLGAFDAEGNLIITGRIKELIITAGGKNVAPVEIENHLKNITGVGQAVVVGDRQPYLCALITLDPENLEALASAAGVAVSSAEAMSADPKVRAFLEGQIERNCNAKLARYQTIKKFEVLPNDFTVEGGEVTASLKIRRNIVAEKYAEQIARFYAGGTQRAASA